MISLRFNWLEYNRAKNQIRDGLIDSLKGFKCIKKFVFAKPDPRPDYFFSIKSDLGNSIFKRVIQCCLLNGLVFWVSILLFNHGVMPLLEYIAGHCLDVSLITRKTWNVTSVLLNYMFNAFWILPLFLISRLINCFWYKDIADAAHRANNSKPLNYPSFSKLIADTLFSLIQQSIFLIQCQVVSFLPFSIFTHLIVIIHYALLYSIYSFEYQWFYLGWPVIPRLNYVQRHWCYFLGFGLPLAVCTYIPSSYIVSGIVFSLLFPISILSASATKTTAINHGPGQESTLDLFAPSIWASDFIISNMAGLATLLARSLFLMPPSQPVPPTDPAQDH